MPVSAKLFASDGRTAFRADYKNYVYKGKYNPTSVGSVNFSGTTQATGFQIILPRGTGNILPFVRSVGGQTAGIFYIKTDAMVDGGQAFANASGNTIEYISTATPLPPWDSNISASVQTSSGAYVSCNITSYTTPVYKAWTVGSLTVYGYSTNLTFDTSLTVNKFGLLKIQDMRKTIVCTCNGGSTTTTQWEVYVFEEINGAVGSGYGMRAYDSSGNVTFDSNQKILKLAGVARTPYMTSSAYNPLPTIDLEAGTVPTNHAFFCVSMGKYERMGDNPSAFYRQKSVQRQAIHVKRKSSTQLLCDGTGIYDAFYTNDPNSPEFQEGPSTVIGGSPGNAQILIIDTDNYA
jgi:hypothetical protein